MHTAKIILTSILSSLLFICTAQVKGNYNYRSLQSYSTAGMQIPRAGSLARLEAFDHNTFSIKGLYNVKADSYLAIFTLTQLGKTQRETDSLVRAKTNYIKSQLKARGETVEMYVDMISFIPIFEVEVTKKLFRKDTYNEIPKGFELKKNLHFRYNDPSVLEDLVRLCAEQEIYDLVRVDYFIDDLAAKKAELMSRAELLLKKELDRYQRILGHDFKGKQKRLADGFAMHYPIEQYQSYTAYCSNKLNVVQNNGVLTQATKTTSEFYMPKMAKGYDFVINNNLLEPVVQIEYELVLNSIPAPVDEQKPIEIVKTQVDQQVILVTPKGELKQLPL